MTAPLFEKLANDVADWRQSGYPCKEYPLIGEILSWQQENREDELPFLKFLRDPQFLALEVYWYVRLVHGTPHVMDLYKKYYGNDKAAFFSTLGVSIPPNMLNVVDMDGIITAIKEDEAFVREHKIQALHEAACLEYPSYILALAMGAGKTVLIGAIIATEFAMSLRHPKGNFMKNALVFAPGTTIIESLRELSDMPFEKILPPDLNRDFLANLKIEFPDKGKELQTQQGSSYNLIVTNTEKIILRAKRTGKQKESTFKENNLQANLRLQKITSLPNLGVFSDEAHHTYGNDIFKDLKRVRETINHIHEKTSLVAVINTTGTPYYNKQTLKEVIVWYGLGDGIRDNILKNLNDGIHQYDIGDQPEEVVFGNIIDEFFANYGKVTLPNGAKAKIAFYFNTQKHLETSRAFIERAMTENKEAVSQILVNTQASNIAEIDEFKRLNNPSNQKRVILLIGKGVEGWNCPSLFACALIKEQTSNNYVLQAATRCLRQTSGNQHSAKIFLDDSNAKILDKELQDNFGTDLDRITTPEQDKVEVVLRIQKSKLPKLEITRTIKRVVRTKPPNGEVILQKPKAQKPTRILRSILTPDFDGPREMLMPTGLTIELPAAKEITNCHTAAWKIASRYHLPVMPVLKKIKEIYPKGEMPNSHLQGLFQQVEKQQANYKTVKKTMKEVLALIKMQDENGKDIFEKIEDGVYVHRLRMLRQTYNRMKQHGLFAESREYQSKGNLSFHYEPYNFDSKPERSAFQKILSILNANPNEVAAFLFTGGLTDPNKTDLHFEYLGKDNRYHRYFPDFVIVKKTGEFYIIEIKSSNDRSNETVKAKQKSVEQIQNLQSEQFKYQVVYTPTATIGVEDVAPIKQWVSS